MNNNVIGNHVSKAIKEGKWLNIKYINTNNEDREFWIAIYDINCTNRMLKVWIFNNNDEQDILDSSIYFEKIQSATVLEFTSYQRPDNLIEKIENNLEQYRWLNYDYYNYNILNYYMECSILDNDPVQKKFTTIEGIDLLKLSKNYKIEVNNKQAFQIIGLIYEYDFKKVYNKYYSLVINRLSLDKGKKKYIICYHKLSYNPKEKSLVLDPSLEINKSFLVDGRPCSLHKYVPMDLDEFSSTFEERNEYYQEMIKWNCHNGERINTMPDMMILEKEISVKLADTFSEIENQYNNKRLSMPLKSFFGNISKIISRRKKRKEQGIIIYDRFINLNQIRVVYNSLMYPVTFVQGPPGTGKTQTILNVIISAFFNNRTVLVCSSNNKPVDGINEKLKFSYKIGNKEREIPFPFLRLGRHDEVEEATKKIIEYYELAKTINEQDLLNEIKRSRDSIAMDIDFDINSPDMDVDDEYFNNDDNLEKALEKMKEKIMKRQEDFFQHISQFEKRLDLTEDHKNCQQLLNSLNNENNKMANNVKAKIQRKQREIENIPEITENKLLSILETWNENSLFKKYFYYRSLQLIKDLRKPRYKELIETCRKEKDERSKVFNEYCSEERYMKRLLKIFPIILTTNISTYRLGPCTQKFDLVIMDEAGQCNIASSLIPITRAKNLLLVGDPNQLRPVIVLEDSVNKKLMNKYNVPEQYNYLKYSILDVMTSTDKISKYIFLNYHYRCGKKIINFSNQRYYNNKLDLSKINEDGSVELLSVKNNNVMNRNEAYDEAQEIINYIKRNKVSNAYIVTPFVNQKDLINSMLKRENLDHTIKCGTIHSLQGSEEDCIIFSAAISKRTSKRTYEWIKNNYELINVAITRAKKKLIIAADTEIINVHSDKSDDLYHLIRYIQNTDQTKVPPIESTVVEIGYSNGSSTENEFYKTIRHFCTCYPYYTAERNVKIYKLLPGNENDNYRRYGELELDLVLYSCNSDGVKQRPIIAFEVNGGEHIGEPKREQSDNYKRKICTDHNILLITIPNSDVKDYLSIMNTIFLKTTNNNNE